jgi:hypothetical protein
VRRVVRGGLEPPTFRFSVRQRFPATEHDRCPAGLRRVLALAVVVSVAVVSRIASLGICCGRRLAGGREIYRSPAPG